MKKFLLTVFAITLFAISLNAQTDSSAKPKLTKEEKLKLKAKADEDLNNSFKEAGLSAEQIAQVKNVMDSSRQQTNIVKKNDALKPEEKEAQLKDINQAKNEMLKAIMGKEKYRLWTEIKKKQKQP